MQEYMHEEEYTINNGGREGHTRYTAAATFTAQHSPRAKRGTLPLSGRTLPLSAIPLGGDLIDLDLQFIKRRHALSSSYFPLSDHRQVVLALIGNVLYRSAAAVSPN